MTPAERQQRFRAKTKPGYCITCTKRKAIKGRKKCLRCTYEAIANVYESRGKEIPRYEDWLCNRRKRKK